MNETLKVINSRYSCRDFADTPPTDEQLRAIATAAIAAPSANNGQRWRVIVIKNKELIGELESEGMKALAELPDKGIFERITSRGGALFYHAPCVVFVAIEPNTGLDCGIVSQNISLAAESLGLGSCICGLAGFAFSEKKSTYFKEKLGFPHNYDFGMAVLIGTAKTKGTPHTPDESKFSFIE